MKMLMNWIKQVGNIIGEQKKNNSCFYLEKRKEDDMGKKTRQVPLD